MQPENMSFVIVVGMVLFTVIIMRILGNRRSVTRNTLHGQVTYVIKGYGGTETRHIMAEAADQDAKAKIINEAVRDSQDGQNGGKTL